MQGIEIDLAGFPFEEGRVFDNADPCGFAVQQIPHGQPGAPVGGGDDNLVDLLVLGKIEDAVDTAIYLILRHFRVDIGQRDETLTNEGRGFTLGQFGDFGRVLAYADHQYAALEGIQMADAQKNPARSQQQQQR